MLAIVIATSFAHAQTGSTVRLQADAIITLPAGAGLTAIADGDFNHDNRRDLAVCERNLGQVALYMRSATGTYPKAKFTYAVGQNPSGLVSFNRQAGTYHADLMALSGPSSQWTMLRDDLDTTGFLVRRVLTPGFGTGAPSPRPVLLQTDLNQDSNPDFLFTYPVVFNSFVNYAEYADDTFSPNARRTYATPYFNTATSRSTNLALADFDANGGQDVVLADSAGNTVHVASGTLLRGVYTIDQQERVSLQTTGRGPVATAAADIDGDQLPDLAVAYAGSNEVMLLRTTTTFGFNRQYSYGLPASPRRVLFADLNRDFYPDMLVVSADNQLRVYQHNGLGSALCYTTIPPQVLATGVNPSLLQIAYLNNDVYPDIVVGCAGDNTVHTYLNTSATVSASRSRSLLDVQVYPTRATDYVTVRQAQARKLNAVLVDEMGRTVRQQELTQETTTVATAGLPRGLYLLRLTGRDGTRTTRIVLE